MSCSHLDGLFTGIEYLYACGAPHLLPPKPAPLSPPPVSCRIVRCDGRARLHKNKDGFHLRWTLRLSSCSACARPSRPPHRPDTGSEASSKTPLPSPHTPPQLLERDISPTLPLPIERGLGFPQERVRAAPGGPGWPGRNPKSGGYGTGSNRAGGG